MRYLVKSYDIMIRWKPGTRLIDCPPATACVDKASDTMQEESPRVFKGTVVHGQMPSDYGYRRIFTSIITGAVCYSRCSRLGFGSVRWMNNVVFPGNDESKLLGNPLKLSWAGPSQHGPLNCPESAAPAGPQTMFVRPPSRQRLNPACRGRKLKHRLLAETAQPLNRPTSS